MYPKNLFFVLLFLLSSLLTSTAQYKNGLLLTFDWGDEKKRDQFASFLQFQQAPPTIDPHSIKIGVGRITSLSGKVNYTIFINKGEDESFLKNFQHQTHDEKPSLFDQGPAILIVNLKDLQRGLPSQWVDILQITAESTQGALLQKEGINIPSLDIVRTLTLLRRQQKEGLLPTRGIKIARILANGEQFDERDNKDVYLTADLEDAVEIFEMIERIKNAQEAPKDPSDPIPQTYTDTVGITQSSKESVKFDSGRAPLPSCLSE